MPTGRVTREEEETTQRAHIEARSHTHADKQTRLITPLLLRVAIF